MYENNFKTSGWFYIQNQTYDYTFEGTTYTDQNRFACNHLLANKPRRSKAMYVGKLYFWELIMRLQTDYVLDGRKKGA
jgi:hypothetical protein